MQRLAFSIAALALPGLAAAEPLSGRLMRQSDGSVLTYNCQSLGVDRINCDFVQVMFQRDGSVFLDRLDATVDELLNSETGLVRASCPSLPLEAMRLAVETNDPLPVLQDMDLQALRDDPEGAGKFTKALVRLCGEKSSAAAEDLLAVATQLSSMTCYVSVNRYSQVFTRIENDLWVAVSAPSGTYGAVDTSRFVGAVITPGEEPFIWDLEASKVITNPTGQDVLGISCSDLDQTPSTFSWRSSNARTECTYMR